MKPLPTLKILLGLGQKTDPEISDALDEAVNVSYEKIGSFRSVHQNDVGIDFGALVHSLGFEGFLVPDVLLAAVGGRVFRNYDTIKSGLSGRNVQFSAQAGRIYFTNNSDGMFMFDGSLPVYRAGSPIPNACTAGAGGGTGFTGTYNIKVTYGNANGFDGNPSTAAAVVLANQDISVTAIPTNSNSDYNITKRKLWIQGGTTPAFANFVLCKTLSDNTTTTANIATTDVDTTTLLNTDNDTPQAFSFLVNHYDTFFGAGLTAQPNHLYFSKVAAGEQWPLTNAIIVSRSGDPIMWISSWDGVLWVLTRKHVYQVIGSPGSGTLSTNFYLKETRSSYGTIASRSVVHTPYGTFFQSEDGIRRFDGNDSVIFSNEVEDLLNGRNENDAVESLSVGAFWDDKLLLSFASSANTAPDTTVIYDFKVQKWSSHDRGYLDFAVDRKNNALYGAHSTGIDRFRMGPNYANWSVKTSDRVVELGSYAAWGKFQVDMVGSCDVQVYLDGSVAQSYSISAPSRQFNVRRFPLGLSQRAALRLIANAKSTQDIVYQFGWSAEIQRGQI